MNKWTKNVVEKKEIQLHLKKVGLNLLDQISKM